MSDSTKISGVKTGLSDLGNKAGFVTSGYQVKHDVGGEMFNQMPPGMDIENQVRADIRPMPMKKVVDGSYPGDGW